MVFDKSKIIWHLTQIEIAADTDQRMREPIAQMAMKSGAMDRALKFAKENEDRALGAVYLVVCLCEMALDKNAPRQLADALEGLLFASIDVLEARYKENPLTCEILQHQMMELEEKFLARKFTSETPPATNSGPAAASEMPITGNMPDVTQRGANRVGVQIAVAGRVQQWRQVMDCPVCGQSASDITYPDSRSRSVRCSACRDYDITGTASAKFDAANAERRKEALARAKRFARAGQRPCIDSRFI